MKAAAKVLDRLQRVKQTRPDNYVAACPCCQSKQGRPISVRDMDDGRCLIHAFCGCQTEDVLSAIGLALGDLFDAPRATSLPPVRGGLNSRELLELLSHEANVATLLACDAQRRPLTDVDVGRLAQEAERLGKAHAMAHGR